MPISPTYPGVYIQEVSSGVRTITGVSTSVAAFVGRTNRGRVGRPTRILSFTDYERHFGSDTATSEMTDQVRQFFFNGGQQAFVMRIANGAVPAGVTLQNEFGTEVLVVSAKEEGVIGQSIRLEIDYDTPTPESTFNLRVFRQHADNSGTLIEAEEESYAGLNMNPASGLYAVDILTQQSNLITASLPAALNVGAEAISGYTVAARLFEDAADLRTQINNGIAATGNPANEGQVRVAVDGLPPVNVTLATIPGADDPDTALQNAINGSLATLGLGLGVTVDIATAGPSNGGAGTLYLRVISNAANGSVVFSPGQAFDITAALEFTAERGALVVGAHARLRPAPSGHAFRPDELDTTSGTWLQALTQLAEQEPTAIDSFQIDDSIGSFPAPSPFVLTPATIAGGTLIDGTTVSLNRFSSRLREIRDAFNNAAAADPDFRWSAAVHGYRLILRPTSSNPNTSPSAFSTSPTYNLGAAGNGLDLGANRGNVKYYSLEAAAAGDYQTGTDGNDGAVPQPGDYEAAYATLDSELDIFNLLILPRAAAQTDADMANLWGAASIFCQSRRAFLLVDPPRDAGTGWNTIDDVSSGIANFRIGITTDHAAVYWPQVTIPSGSTTRNIAPSGSLAGLMARTDASRGVWKAPAGTEATLRNVRGVQRGMSDRENGVINPLAVNALRVFPNGVVSWGARTMIGFNNSGNDDYKYVPVRRFALFLEESLYRGLKFAVFEPNDEPLWAQIRLAAGAFMNNLFRQGAFQGQKASDAYFVKVDSETTTQNDINLGIVNVLVGFAPLKPAEFIIITIQQRAGEVQV